MSIRSGGRQLSFELLASDGSGDGGLFSPFPSSDNAGGDGGVPIRRKKKSKASKKKKQAAKVFPKPFDRCYGDDEIGFKVLADRSVVETVYENTVFESFRESCVSYVELRQRNADRNGIDEMGGEMNSARESSAGEWRPELNGRATKLEKEESLDWNRMMAENPNLLGEVSPVDKAPLKYFIGEVYGGNSLRSTISAGNDKKRQRVYNTMFHVPWRCERLIVAGFFVCLDSFLSLLTIMPARILMTIWRVVNTRQLVRPNAAELSDYGCFVVLVLGISSLQMIDISLIYHVIRGQGTIKLYVIYNVLEIFDKLCQSFGEDILQVLFNSAEGLSNCSPDKTIFEVMRFFLDEAIAVIAFVVHSFVLLAQAITLSTCIIAHNNALLALLVSNNFAEIKSNVFKRVSKENLHDLVYYERPLLSDIHRLTAFLLNRSIILTTAKSELLDIVERFHITAFLLFVLAQNILEAEGPWFESFLKNALLVFVCEMLVDAIKHSFLAKFNEIKPVAYSDFLEDLCTQTLNEKPDERRKDLTFIPLAPACVVIRVLTPVYANLLPYGPFMWRLFWIFLWSTLTYIMLAICKILVGLSLRKLATWYINLRLRRKQHVD